MNEAIAETLLELRKQHHVSQERLCEAKRVAITNLKKYLPMAPFFYYL
ncbi:MAG: hypothetical protein KBT11_03205 [Treponema sp.]|nr:hypothetical protein [Candidatus Treponema equifaecale]